MTNDHWWHPSVRLWNTLTNAAYPLVGWLLYAQFGTDRALDNAVAMTVLGLYSGAYHWWRNDFTRGMDWFGMVNLFVTQAAFAADPGSPWSTLQTSGLSFAIATTLILGFKAVGHDAVLGLGLFLTMLPPLFAGPLPAGMALLSLLLFGIAKVFHSEDDQVGHKGHGMWHLLTAMAFGVMFLAIVLMRTL